MTGRACIDRVEAVAYRFPTDQPEADGTLEWSSTTLVVATVGCGNQQGIGYTYGHAGIVEVIADPLCGVLVGGHPLDIPQLAREMRRVLRNIGRPGLGMMAIAALDHALWDLKGRMLGCSVLDLFGRARDAVPVYGSGGFTSYTEQQLQRQLAGFVKQGIPRVKMKVGAEPELDPGRVRAAREAIGADVSLMVDANGALQPTQALALAEAFADSGVCWFEEPLSSDDLAGLARLRERLPIGMQQAAGEYGWDDWYFARMLDAGAVDVLQVDSTRCGGFTGFLQASAMAAGRGVPVSAHCSPHLHAHVCSALPQVANIEYFHDHVRIEQRCFDGLPQLVGGALQVDSLQPGLGLTLKRQDIERFRVSH
jgi:L-alanine-DL-glutamate epimerase-like enolase superfamily enzyme